MQLAGAAGNWEMDFDAMEAAANARTRLFLQCNPQNPTGRVYRRDELLALANFAERHNMIVCSDEIHCGLVIDPDSRHIPLASLDPAIAARTITLMAPTKTFNIPGLGCSLAIIPDRRLRTAFHDRRAGLVPGISPFAYAAAEAAMRDDGRWQAALLDYLAGNHAELHSRVNAIAGLSCNRVEATYLAWIRHPRTGPGQSRCLFRSSRPGPVQRRRLWRTGFCTLQLRLPAQPDARWTGPAGACRGQRRFIIGCGQQAVPVVWPQHHESAITGGSHRKALVRPVRCVL